MADTQNTERTEADLKERLSEVFEEIFAQGRRAGWDAGYKKGLAEGGRIERERIRAVHQQALPGHEALIEELAYDGVTSGADAAQKILAAQKVKAKAAGPLSKIKQVLTGERPKATAAQPEPTGDTGREPLPASADPGGPRAAAPGLSVEERCKAEWEHEPGLHAMFGTLEAYTAVTRQHEDGAEPEPTRAMPEPARPVHAAPIQEPVRGGVTGGVEAARKVVAAAKATAEDILFGIMADPGHEPLPVSGGQRAASPGPSLEERCRVEWEREPGLHGEFGTLENYRAFVRQREAGNAPT